jgi:hypothetical protein
MSVAPAAIDGLMALLRDQPALQGVQILDGPQAKWPGKDFIVIGLSPEDPTVSTTRLPAGLSASSTTETADITCMVRSWSGSTAVKLRRDRAYELVAAAQAVVVADPTLGGACSHAEVTGSIYAPSQSTGGVIVDVVFVVQARTF